MAFSEPFCLQSETSHDRFCVCDNLLKCNYSTYNTNPVCMEIKNLQVEIQGGKLKKARLKYKIPQLRTDEKYRIMLLTKQEKKEERDVSGKKKAGVLKKDGLTNNVRKYWPYYVMIIPGLVYFIAFKYIPMLGSVIAFQDYSVFKGILDSDWVGLKNFRELLNYADFRRIFSNTLILGLLKTVVLFPIPVILSLMINEVKNIHVKKVIQTAIYIPYFLSWVIVGGLVFDIFGVGGLFNNIREALGLDLLLAMQKESWFRPIYVISSI